MTNIEIRLYLDPNADELVRRGILKGLGTYMDEEGFNPKVTLGKYQEAIDTEKKIRNSRGQVDIERWLDILSEEKEAIANWYSKDKSHWDVVVTSQDVCPSDTSQWNFVFGGFQGFYEKGRPDLASAVISVFRLKDRNSELSLARGTLVGYHEASHLKEAEHCADKKCIHYHAFGGLNDLDKIASYLMQTDTIPKCNYHSRR